MNNRTSWDLKEKFESKVNAYLHMAPQILIESLNGMRLKIDGINLLKKVIFCRIDKKTLILWFVILIFFES